MAESARVTGHVHSIRVRTERAIRIALQGDKMKRHGGTSFRCEKGRTRKLGGEGFGLSRLYHWGRFSTTRRLDLLWASGCVP